MQLGSEVEVRTVSRLVLILVAVGVSALALSGLLFQWDKTVSAAIRARDLPGDVRKAIELSEAFAHGSGVVAILLTLFLASNRSRARILAVALMTAVCGIAANLLKVAFTRARPYTYDAAADAMADVTGWEFLGTGSFWDASQRSFPSGHTATAWALAIGLCLVFPRAKFMFIFLAVMATYQRLFSGAHFPSDAAAGFGIACLGCAAVLSIPRFRRSLCTAEN
jgi:membrane-associated phospholipid phosphatase